MKELNTIAIIQYIKTQNDNCALVLVSPKNEPDYEFELDVCLDEDSNLIIDKDFICEYKLNELKFLKII